MSTEEKLNMKRKYPEKTSSDTGETEAIPSFLLKVFDILDVHQTFIIG